jgi:hypothetical protein
MTTPSTIHDLALLNTQRNIWFFFLLHEVQICCGANPSSCPMGTGLKRLILKAGHLTPSSALLKNDGVKTSLPHTHLPFTFYFNIRILSRGSDWLRTGWSSPGRIKNFHFSISSRPALGPTQPSIQWVPVFFPREYTGRGVKLTTQLQLVPRSRERGSIHRLPHTSLWRSA